MTTLLIIAVVLACLWLLALTIGVLLCIRQLGAITVRVQLLGAGGGANAHGSSIGFRITDELARLHPEIAAGRRVVLLVSSNCETCLELVEDMRTGGGPRSLTLPDELIVLLPGDDHAAVSRASAAFGARAQVLVDPLALMLARGLKMANVPSALLLEDGLITGDLLFVDDFEQIDRLVSVPDHSAASANGNGPSDVALQVVSSSQSKETP